MTKSPIVTGASVLGVKYNEGVLLVTDTLASYGSLAKFTGVTKFRKVGESTVIGASGEFSDFQYIGDALEELADREWTQNDGVSLTPKGWSAYLTRLLHNRRNKMDPLLNQVVVAGVDGDEQLFLSYVDLYGTAFEDDFVATGYGGHLAIPVLREKARLDMSLEEAIELLRHCMRILFYRDCRTTDMIQFAKVSRAGGVEISAIEKLESKWDHQLWTTPTITLGPMLGASW